MTVQDNIGRLNEAVKRMQRMEAIARKYGRGALTWAEARARLKALGVSDDEISDALLFIRS